MLSIFATRAHHRGSQFPQDAGATSAIEFALVAPVLFTILFGIVTFGVHYSARVALTYAASEGGRAAVAGLTDAERTSLAQGAIQSTLVAMWPLVDTNKAVVNVNLADESGNKAITISIGYNDARFAKMPFLPDLSHLDPVTVRYYVTDPSG